MAKNVNDQFGLGGKTTVAEGYEPKGKSIKKLKEMIGESRKRLFGYLITKDAGYGQGVLLCAESCMISLPKRYLEVFEDYDDNQKELLKSGRMYIENVTEIETKQGKTCVFDLTMDD